MRLAVVKIFMHFAALLNIIVSHRNTNPKNARTYYTNTEIDEAHTEKPIRENNSAAIHY